MPLLDLRAVQAMTSFTCCRPDGNLDLGDVDAVENALAKAKDVVSIAIGGAKFGQADQVPHLCTHAAIRPVKAIQHLQSRWVTEVADQHWRHAPLPFLVLLPCCMLPCCTLPCCMLRYSSMVSCPVLYGEKLVIQPA